MEVEKKKKHSGRPVGAKSKTTIMARKEFEKMAETELAAGETPLGFLLRVMRDESRPPAIRLRCASEAAPYCHSKAPVININQNIEVGSHEEWLASLDDVTDKPELLE